MRLFTAALLSIAGALAVQTQAPARPPAGRELVEVTSIGADFRKPPQRVRVGAAVQERRLIRKVEPAYPQKARQARIRGVVRFTVIIAKDGHVSDIQLVSGHPLLVTAAREAVAQWVYRPTLLNGQPVEVVTSVNVILGEETSPPTEHWTARITDD